jgi:hypothetical protein
MRNHADLTSQIRVLFVLDFDVLNFDLHESFDYRRGARG